MKRLNILDLHRTINEKKERQTVCFENVLSRIHKKIQKSADEKKLRCVYEIPTFIFGLPLFDLNDCIEFVMSELKANGFIVTYYFPNMLYVSWDFEEINKNKAENKATQIVSQNTKQIVSNPMMKYKTSGKLELNLF
jgi:hypothetical protein